MPKKSKAPPMPDSSARFWRLEAVMAYTQRSRSSIYRDPDFPKPVRLAPNTAAWVAEEIKAWADARIAERGR
jgi:predicted DNA-binding transcriptional regulator AlpA